MTRERVLWLALAGAAAAGGWCARGEEPVRVVQVERVIERVVTARAETREERGPVRVSVRREPRVVATPGGGQTVVWAVERLVERGPVRREAFVGAQEASRDAFSDRSASGPGTPARASWAASAGLRLLPSRALEVGLERRLFGPAWARAWAAIDPDRAPQIGVGLRVEW